MVMKVNIRGKQGILEAETERHAGKQQMCGDEAPHGYRSWVINLRWHLALDCG